MIKEEFIRSGVISFLVFVFLLISKIFSSLLSLVLSAIVFIFVFLVFDIFNSKEEEKLKNAKKNQSKILEKAFMRGQTGAFKGYGFNKQNKGWVLKGKK